MSETMREALPIIFMYGCVLALGPFIAFAMWMAFDGDRLREPEVVVEPTLVEATTTTTASPAQPQVTAEATSAA
jgi:hypothetical protein